MENSNYTHLHRLKDSNYQIVEGEPYIIGWDVKNEAGTYIGKIIDLLFESERNAVRYLVIDLTDNGMHLADKKVLIPIGIAHLHTTNDEVIVPNIHLDQFAALPSYDGEHVSPETEVQIRSIIGSPAALRIEQEIVEFDQQVFYDHHHFNKEQFYQRNRTDEQQTIHNLVEHSKEHHFHAAEAETGRNTHHNEHRQKEFHPGEHEIKPWLQPGASHHQGGEQNDDKPNPN